MGTLVKFGHDIFFGGVGIIFICALVFGIFVLIRRFVSYQKEFDEKAKWVLLEQDLRRFFSDNRYKMVRDGVDLGFLDKNRDLILEQIKRVEGIAKGEIASSYLKLKENFTYINPSILEELEKRNKV